MVTQDPIEPKQSWEKKKRAVGIQSLWTDVEAETPILWPPDVKNWLIGKDLDAGKDWRREKKEKTKDEMIGWHYWLNGHEFE